MSDSTLTRENQFYAEISRLRADLAVVWRERSEFAKYIDEVDASLAQRTAERDEAQLQLQRLRCEISCRVEHGADSNGHLEAILAMLKKEAKR